MEPIIGHLKADHRLSRNFYKGIVGDNINIMLAAAAFNFKRVMNRWKKKISHLFQTLFFFLHACLSPSHVFLSSRKNLKPTF
ncbi:MAG: hypothetical protein KBG14_05805 [Bacteroidales bacterium]|nr:hypothetical protein [Bacteroidales bacterium]